MSLRSSKENRCRILASMLPFVAALIAGCGGTSDTYVGESAGDEYSRMSGMSNRGAHYYGPAAGTPVSSLPPVMSPESVSSSVTLNPVENFKGFNHEIWNDDRAWYECNCGDTQPELPKKMPWNPSA